MFREVFNKVQSIGANRDFGTMKEGESKNRKGDKKCGVRRLLRLVFL